MSNRYCITFNIMDTNEKIKIDYGCVQVEEQCLKVNMNMFTFKSSISNEIFTLKKDSTLHNTPEILSKTSNINIARIK